jgi:hypothetical protein
VGLGMFVAHYWHTASGYHARPKKPRVLYSRGYLIKGEAKKKRSKQSWTKVGTQNILKDHYFGATKRKESDVPLTAIMPKANVLLRNVEMELSTRRGMSGKIPMDVLAKTRGLMAEDPEDWQVWYDRPAGTTVAVQREKSVEWRIQGEDDTDDAGDEGEAGSEGEASLEDAFQSQASDHTGGGVPTQIASQSPKSGHTGRGSTTISEEDCGDELAMPVKRGRGRPRKGTGVRNNRKQSKTPAPSRRRSPRLAMAAHWVRRQEGEERNYDTAAACDAVDVVLVPSGAA